jgi:hypothetical protein
MPSICQNISRLPETLRDSPKVLGDQVIASWCQSNVRSIQYKFIHVVEASSLLLIIGIVSDYIVHVSDVCDISHLRGTFCLRVLCVAEVVSDLPLFAIVEPWYEGSQESHVIALRYK